MKYRILISAVAFIFSLEFFNLSLDAQSAEVYQIKRSGEQIPLTNPQKQESTSSTLPVSNNSFTSPTTETLLTQGATIPATYGWQQDHKTTQPTLPESIIDPGQFVDHSILGQVYQKIVKRHGWVDYRKLKQDRSLQTKLANYIADLSQMDPDTLTDPRDRLAAWLNLYNAFVLQEILKHYPIRHLNQVPDFFSKQHFKVGAKTYSLLEIEQMVFLENIREPRAVFARVHGTVSSAKLRDKPYHPLKLEEQLEEQTWQFLLDRNNVHYDPKRRTLILSPLLLWYQQEFVDPILFLRNYLDLLPEIVSINYRGYDWTLNDEKLH